METEIEAGIQQLGLKITPVFIDSSNFSFHKYNKDSTGIYYNGLLVAKILYSKTLKDYWLNMVNISEQRSQHNDIKCALETCRQNVIFWLEDK